VFGNGISSIACYWVVTVRILLRSVSQYASSNFASLIVNGMNSCATTEGVGTDGISAAHLAARGGIDAISLLFTPTDVYNGVLYPGGIPAGPQARDHAKLTAALDTGASITSVQVLVIIVRLIVVLLSLCPALLVSRKEKMSF
jgi:hypothetical protein